MTIMRDIMRSPMREITRAVTAGLGGGSTLAFSARLTSSLFPTPSRFTNTFARGTLATVPAFDPSIVTLDAGEAGHEGGRRVKNIVFASEFSSAHWAVSSSAVKVATHVGIGPNGEDAEELDLTAGALAKVSDDSFPYTSGGDVVSSVWVRTVSGTDSITLYNNNTTSSDFPINETWQRLSVLKTGVTTGRGWGIKSASTVTLGNIYATSIQLEDVTGQSNQNPGEYVSVGVGTGSELITNGDFSTDSDWSNSATATHVISGGSCTVTCNAQWDGIYQDFTRTKVRKDFVATIDISNISSGTINAALYNAPHPGGSGDISNNLTSDGQLVISGTRSSVTGIGHIRIRNASGSGTFDVDNVTVKEADHGAGVDGVEWFERENGNTVASNVVTEATGAAIPAADLLGPRIERAATNYADGDDDLGGGAETIDLTAGGTGDYTLSVSSDAAVTVAAGTATGTGFAQATLGSDVTFNLSVVGTVTLTLDSGTLDTMPSGAAIKQVEKGSYATTHIETSGAAATRDKTEGPEFAITLETNDFTIACDWTPQEDSGGTQWIMVTGTNGNNYIGLLYDGTDLDFRKVAAGVPNSADKTFTPTAGVTYRVVGRLSSSTGSDIWVDGVKEANNPNTDDAVVGTALHIGEDYAGAGHSAMNVANIVYHTAAKSDDEAAAL